jgi:hypothetical protein
MAARPLISAESAPADDPPIGGTEALACDADMEDVQALPGRPSHPGLQSRFPQVLLKRVLRRSAAAARFARPPPYVAM